MKTSKQLNDLLNDKLKADGFRLRRRGIWVELLCHEQYIGRDSYYDALAGIERGKLGDLICAYLKGFEAGAIFGNDVRDKTENLAFRYSGGAEAYKHEALQAALEVVPFTELPSWRTGDGEIIPVSALEDTHLLNILRYMSNKQTSRASLFPALMAEAKKRDLGVEGIKPPLNPNPPGYDSFMQSWADENEAENLYAESFIDSGWGDSF